MRKGKKILAFSCSFESINVGLAFMSGNTLYKYIQHSRNSKKQGHLLLESIAKMLSNNDVQLKEIDLLAVFAGPGAFTSLRASMAIAKGLAFADGIPIVSVSTLRACYSYRSNWNGLLIPIIDARTKRVFSCIARKGRALTPEYDITVDEIIELCKSKRKKDEAILISGEDAVLAYAHFKKVFPTCIIDSSFPALSLQSLVYTACKAFKAGKVLRDDGAPVYIRAATTDIHGAKKRSTGYSKQLKASI